jgi:hypothetical protein
MAHRVLFLVTECLAVHRVPSKAGGATGYYRVGIPLGLGLDGLGAAGPYFTRSLTSAPRSAGAACLLPASRQLSAGFGMLVQMFMDGP